MSESAASVSSLPGEGESPLVRWVSEWGSAVVDGITTIGDMTIFMWQMLKWMFTRWPYRGTILINF